MYPTRILPHHYRTEADDSELLFTNVWELITEIAELCACFFPPELRLPVNRMDAMLRYSKGTPWLDGITMR